MINLKINEKELKDINLIIFDKDGTLFELYPYWSKVALKRAEAISSYLNTKNDSLIDWLVLKMGIDSKNMRICPNGPIGIYHRKYIQDLLYNELKSRGYHIDKKNLQHAFEEADDYINKEDILSSSLIPVKGMMEFLKEIKGKCKCAIYSNDLTDRLQKISELFQIKENFDIFLGGDLIKHPKPDAWGAKKIMNNLSVLPENTAFVGDSIFDIECGKNAQCKFLIAITSDISDIESLQIMSTSVIVDFSEIEVLTSQ
jgi:HAD superfamily hydrolase (TIGR01549 family)